jgi:hypothetical protein
MKATFLKRVLDIDDNQFLSDLRVTQAYCEQQLKQKGKPDSVILRSIINLVYKDGKWLDTPSFEVSNSDEQTILWEEWSKIADPYDLESFNKLFYKQIEYKRTLINKPKHENIYQGKIVVVEYGLNIPDGAAEVETEFFFDEFDLPAIDTWFFKASDKRFGGILFAWIPNKAIDIQFLNIIHWFEDWAPLDYQAIVKTK